MRQIAASLVPGRGDEDKLAGWLAEEACLVELGEEALREAVLVRCRAERIEPTGRIARIIGAARAAFEARFCQRTVSRLDEPTTARLLGRLDPRRRDRPRGAGLLGELKADPGPVGLVEPLNDGPSRPVRIDWTPMTTDMTTELTLVLGGTGTIGRRVAKGLAAGGVPVRVGSRSGRPPFDWNDDTTWAPVLEQVTAACLVYYPDLMAPGGVEAIGRFIDRAMASGARRLVLLSGRGGEQALRAEVGSCATSRSRYPSPGRRSPRRACRTRWSR